MSSVAAVTKVRHSEKSWQRFSSFTFASRYRFAPLVAAEVPKAALNMPMAFVKQQDRFALVGVLSLGSMENLFVARDGKWLGGYIPSAFRGFPFLLGKVEGRTDLMLCVDEDSGLVFDDKNAGEPFFDENGEISQSLREIMDFLSATEKNRKITEVAISSLAEAQLIVQWAVKVGKNMVEGLYRIDDSVLQKIDDPIFLKLRKTGAIPLAYSQLLSMGNIARLEQLALLREKMAPKQQSMVQASDDGEFIRFDE